MSQNQIIAILVLIIGIFITGGSIIINWILNKKKRQTLANPQRGQFLYFLKKYFWMMIFAFGILVIITGISLAVKFL